MNHARRLANGDWTGADSDGEEDMEKQNEGEQEQDGNGEEEEMEVERKKPKDYANQVSVSAISDIFIYMFEKEKCHLGCCCNLHFDHQGAHLCLG